MGSRIGAGAAPGLLPQAVTFSKHHSLKLKRENAQLPRLPYNFPSLVSVPAGSVRLLFRWNGTRPYWPPRTSWTAKKVKLEIAPHPILCHFLASEHALLWERETHRARLKKGEPEWPAAFCIDTVRGQNQSPSQESRARLSRSGRGGDEVPPICPSYVLEPVKFGGHLPHLASCVCWDAAQRPGNWWW
jgi:hypothetical protein